jgi:isoleucyl-tRNA synthetase
LGQDVQQVIRAHKAGDWSIADGVVVVGGVGLVDGEYTLELVAQDDKASSGLSAHDGVVALDIEVTEELEVEGRARDFVRLVQQARRDAGLDVSDRIALTVTAAEDWIEAVTTHEALIAAETLASSVVMIRAGDVGDDPIIEVQLATP